MAETKPTYEDFLFDVPPTLRPFIDETHDYLSQRDCTVGVKTAKNGYVVSYTHKPKKRVLANYVFRKKALVIRIYGDHAGEYIDFLETLPESMRAAIEKSPVCRRLIDPTQCSGTCPMGNMFTLGGTLHKKCRYSCFMFPLSEETTPYVSELLSHELDKRQPA